MSLVGVLQTGCFDAGVRLEESFDKNMMGVWIVSDMRSRSYSSDMIYLLR